MMFTNKKTIYIDNAASSYPKPRNVIKAVNDMLKKNAANPGRSGHSLSVQASQKIYDVRCLSADFFGCDESGIIFTQNATHAINILVKGLLKKGDHVLISDREHNSVLRPLTELKNAGVITFDAVATSVNWIQEFELQIRPNTRLILCTHASNVTGRLFDIAALAKIAKQHNVLFATDASQSAGYTDINMAADGIDYLCTAGHKGLLGPQGSGILAINCNTKILPLTTGGTGTDSLSENQPDVMPESLESGTLATPAIVGMGAGIKYLLSNKKKLNRREYETADYFRQGLFDIKGITVYDVEHKCVPTIAFNVKNRSSEEVADILNNCGICVRGGFHCSALAHKALKTTGQGAVRASFGAFNSILDAEKVLKYIKKI